MNTVTIDNGIATELGKCVLWQYDNATNLVAVINTLKDAFENSTKSFWDNWKPNVVDIDTANDFGLARYGKLLDCPRPTLDYGTSASHNYQILSTALYRKILKARFVLLGGNASVADYCKYVYTIFGDKIKVVDGLNMALSFTVNSGKTLTTEESTLIEQFPDVAFLYPAGVKNNDMGTGLMFGLEEDTVSTTYTHQYGGLNNSTFTWR